MANAQNEELPHKFDPIMNAAIARSGNEAGNPLNEATLKSLLTGYHFDRRTRKTTDQVKKLNPEADDAYVIRVYNQLFDLRETVDRESKINDHQREILQLRIEELRKSIESFIF